MGFFDEFKDTSAGNWVKKDEKEALIRDGQPFPVQGISLEDHSDFGERYVLVTTLPSGEDGADEERKISFPAGTVESRDRMLDAMAKWVEDPANETPVVVLEKVGRSIIIRPAE